jgi:hypothetical protein
VNFWSLLNNLSKQNKSEKWKEVYESLGLAMAVLLQHFVAGTYPDTVRPNVYIHFWALCKKKDEKL